MANPEHLEILKQGKDTWNEWRKGLLDVRLDLSAALLTDAELSGVDLHGVDLNGAQLGGSNVSNAAFYGAYLNNANFAHANLSNTNLNSAEATGANFRHANLSHASLDTTDLSRASLDNAILIGAKLGGVILHSARLRAADLTDAFLRNGKLQEASLRGANLYQTNLVNSRLQLADLGGAFITKAVFSHAELKGADLSGSIMADNIFAALDLREVKGLESVDHWAPSEISISTIYLSGGMIPEAFLQGCGVPESFITQIPALIAAVESIQFHSCFISYSSKDQHFAERLHTDLQARGVRVWFAPHDMKTGARIRPTIDESIRVYDKLLLVLSEASVNSQWVEQEVETALSREREVGHDVLFPVRLDNSVMRINTGWPHYIRNTRQIGDFTDWMNLDSYRRAFDTLLRDLKAES